MECKGVFGIENCRCLVMYLSIREHERYYGVFVEIPDAKDTAVNAERTPEAGMGANVQAAYDDVSVGVIAKLDGEVEEETVSWLMNTLGCGCIAG